MRVYSYNLSFFMACTHIDVYVNSAEPHNSSFRFHSEIMWNHSRESGCQLFTDKMMWKRKTNTLLEMFAKNFQTQRPTKIEGKAKSERASGNQNRFICQTSTNRQAISIGSIHLDTQRSASEWDVCLFCSFIFLVRVTMFEDKIIWYEHEHEHIFSMLFHLP